MKETEDEEKRRWLRTTEGHEGQHSSEAGTQLIMHHGSVLGTHSDGTPWDLC